MNDFNDLLYFASVVEHQGFAAAARATGVEKTRLSRRVAALEARLGVRLLHRSTRSLVLTEAGQRFFVHCQAAVESAQAAYESIADLRREPIGTIRMTCPQLMAETYLAPLLPGYLEAHPKVNLVLDATDREVNLVEERFDLALRVRLRIEDSPGLVARPLGIGHRILVASPAYLARVGCPISSQALSAHDTLGRLTELFEGRMRWELNGPEGAVLVVPLSPRFVANDLGQLLAAAVHGIGIALLPETIVATAIAAGQLVQVLPGWGSARHQIFLLYPSPRGMLPSVRSLIDYLMVHLLTTLQEGHSSRLTVAGSGPRPPSGSDQ